MKIQAKDKILFFKDNLVLRFEAHGQLTVLFLTNNCSSIIDENIDSIDKQLTNTGFIRVHPDHIINVDFISNISDTTENTIILEGGHKVPATRNKTKQIIKLLENHI